MKAVEHHCHNAHADHHVKGVKTRHAEIQAEEDLDTFRVRNIADRCDEVVARHQVVSELRTVFEILHDQENRTKENRAVEAEGDLLGPFAVPAPPTPRKPW